MPDHEKTSTRRGCLRVAVFGCLGLTGLTILAVLVIAAVMLVSRPPAARIESTSTSHPVPAPVAAAGAPTLAETGPCRIVLDIADAEFEVLPGQPGESIRVEGEYDTANVELIETLERDGDGWLFRLTMEDRGSWLQQLLGNSPPNKLRLLIPPDLPVALEGSVSEGKSRWSLGSLRVRSSDLELSMGEHRLEFDRPTSGKELPAEPMETFRIRSSMGYVLVRHLGDASPKRVVAQHGMGHLELDLTGAWLEDSSVAARCSMGHCSITVPRDLPVQISGMPGAEAPGGSGSEGEPVLRLDVGSERFGSIEIQRR